MILVFRFILLKERLYNSDLQSIRSSLIVLPMVGIVGVFEPEVHYSVQFFANSLSTFF